MKALVVATSIVLLALLAIFGWLALTPGPGGGSPVVTLAVTPPPPPKPEPPRPAAPPGIDLPPGFGISPQPQKGKGKAADGQQQAALPEPPESETASITLVAAPAEGLVEESRYGPLPKVAPDGRRPLDVYARPSRYAAKTATGGPPRVALLINGMEMSNAETSEAVLKLPAPVSVSFTAYGRNLQEGVDQARAAGHEVLLRIPLEPADYPTSDPGPHTLLTTLPPDENMKRLQWLMSRFTGYVGVTNLMGAKFETSTESFAPVLEEIKARGLLYLDDGSVPKSVGGKIDGALGLDYATAGEQVDKLPGGDAIAKALAELEAAAKQNGTAIGVAAAKPETVKQVAAWAEQLQGKGFVLIPVSAAIRSQRQS